MTDETPRRRFIRDSRAAIAEMRDRANAESDPDTRDRIRAVAWAWEGILGGAVRDEARDLWPRNGDVDAWDQ